MFGRPCRRSFSPTSAHSQIAVGDFHLDVLVIHSRQLGRHIERLVTLDAEQALLGILNEIKEIDVMTRSFSRQGFWL